MWLLAPNASELVRGTVHLGQMPWPWIVRALETHPKAAPWTIETDFVWSRTCKCSVKSYASGLSTNGYFHYEPNHVGPSTKWVQKSRVWESDLSWSPSFVLDPPLWGGLHAKSLDPQALVLSEVEGSLHFPWIRCFRYQCSRTLKL